MLESKASFSISNREGGIANEIIIVASSSSSSSIFSPFLESIYLSLYLIFRFVSRFFFFPFLFLLSLFFFLFFFLSDLEDRRTFFWSIQKSINDGYSIDDTSLHCFSVSFGCFRLIKYDTSLSFLYYCCCRLLLVDYVYFFIPLFFFFFLL